MSRSTVDGITSRPRRSPEPIQTGGRSTRGARSQSVDRRRPFAQIFVSPERQHPAAPGLLSSIAVLDRRRSSRYVLLASPDADVRTVYEAVVESWDGSRAVVMTRHAAAAGDDFVMRCISASGESRNCVAAVVSSVPVAKNDTKWFRLILWTFPLFSDWLVDTPLAF